MDAVITKRQYVCRDLKLAVSELSIEETHIGPFMIKIYLEENFGDLGVACGWKKRNLCIYYAFLKKVTTETGTETSCYNDLPLRRNVKRMDNVLHCLRLNTF
jgi:hypothetical protein